MKATDAKAYVRAISRQRNIAREVMMNEIMRIAAKLNKNSYSHTEMEVWGDGRLCLVLETFEAMEQDHDRLAKRNEKLASQGMQQAYK